MATSTLTQLLNYVGMVTPNYLFILHSGQTNMGDNSDDLPYTSSIFLTCSNLMTSQELKSQTQTHTQGQSFNSMYLAISRVTKLSENIFFLFMLKDEIYLQTTLC